MDGQFIAQIVVYLLTAGALYGALNEKLKNILSQLGDEKRLREEHAKTDDQSFHDIRDEIGIISTRVARMEGANDLAERVVGAIKGAR